MATRTQRLDSLRRMALDDVTRQIAAEGVNLSWRDADTLGVDVIDWIIHRLSLNPSTTEAGIVFRPRPRCPKGGGQ